MSEWKLVDEFSNLCDVEETESEIIVKGHCGVSGDTPDTRFSKEDHKVEVSDLLRVYKLKE